MAPKSATPDDQLAINTLRFLAVDMVEQAKCGHPGAPMGQAPLAHVLWSRFLRFDPTVPNWPNRDRFVLSCGHASALLYGLLHLAGYDLSLEELRRFRQLGSKTPGHPEYGVTAGVETTTGPLGQGLGNAVGIALSERLLAARFNRQGHALFDYRTWVLASDGDLMEGVGAEAASLAGHLALGHLNVLYDDNKITIDGSTELSFSEDVAKRFEAYGWHTQKVADGNDLEALASAMEAAHLETARPSLLIISTHIGYGSPNKQDSEASHGSPLGAEEARRTKEALGWPLEPTFHVPAAAPAAYEAARARGHEAYRRWQKTHGEWTESYPELSQELERRLSRRLADGVEDLLPRFSPEEAPIATRAASGKVLNALKAAAPELVGGSADLTGSNNTDLEGEPIFSRSAVGRNFRFGVREHAMASALNGLALSGLFRPYGGTFLIFSDYLRPALRLSALMELPVVWVFTHDSIFLGEDGPTHQPIAQLAALRAIPHLVVLRPADANETAAAWGVALKRSQGPTALILSRQNLPVLAGTAEQRAHVARGAYVLAEPEAGPPHLVLLATGSEVSLALRSQQELVAENVRARVVSMPSWELFAEQDRAYRETLLPPGVPILALEAGSSLGWERWVGRSGDVLGIDRFGASAPANDLAEAYGFTPANVVKRGLSLLRR